MDFRLHGNDKRINLRFSGSPPSRGSQKRIRDDKRNTHYDMLFDNPPGGAAGLR